MLLKTWAEEADGMETPGGGASNPCGASPDGNSLF